MFLWKKLECSCINIFPLSKEKIPEQEEWTEEEKERIYSSKRKTRNYR